MHSLNVSVRFLLGMPLFERKVFMCKETDDCNNRNAEYVGKYRIQGKEMNQQPQETDVGKSSASINNTTAEIFLYPISLCSKDKKLIAEKRVRDCQNIYWDCKDDVVYLLSEKPISNGIQPHAEDRVPSPRQKIGQHLVLNVRELPENGNIRSVNQKLILSSSMTSGLFLTCVQTAPRYSPMIPIKNS